ncbi:MAG: hypothetical protein RLW62_17970 [Gammaproteobacteria bacterium]
MDQLSNYELLDLLTSYGTDSGGHFTNLLAVFSAYLVAAYVLAGKLGRMTLALLSALFLVVTCMTATGQWLVQMGIVDLCNEIRVRGAAVGPNIAVTISLISGTSGQRAVYVNAGAYRGASISPRNPGGAEHGNRTQGIHRRDHQERTRGRGRGPQQPR